MLYVQLSLKIHEKEELHICLAKNNLFSDKALNQLNVIMFLRYAVFCINYVLNILI